MMRTLSLALVLAVVGVPAVLGQAISNNPENVVPRFDLSVGYLHIDSNAPPGGCKCFGLNGGYVSGGYRLRDWLSVVGEMTGTHASNISTLGQDLTLMTYTGGPRVAMHVGRLVPFAQALFGVARGSDSYFPTATSFTTSASSFAYAAGGGLDINLTRRFAVRAIEAEYLKTYLPNGADNSQNHIKLAAGIVIKFVGDYGGPPPPPPPPREHAWSEIHFTCGTEVATIDAGQMLEVMGNAETKPDQLDLTYAWATNGGRIQGAGRRITVDTTGLVAGEYHVTGRAALVSNPSTTADCEASFRVNRKPEGQVASTGEPNSPTAKAEAAFHENVQDALFDYDSYKIRPDGQVAIEHAADYLKKHPEIGVTIGGYSDERGSAEYNLALGEKRANAAMDALVAAGVDPGRLKIISYGKEAQVCTAGNEKCWQQNRRAAFNMHY